MLFVRISTLMARTCKSIAQTASLLRWWPDQLAMIVPIPSPDSDTLVLGDCMRRCDRKQPLANSPPANGPSLLATPPTVQPGSTPTRVQRSPLRMAYQLGPRDQVRGCDVSDKVCLDPRCHMLHRSGGPLKSKIKSTSSIPQGLKVCLIGCDTYSPGVASSCGTRFG